MLSKQKIESIFSTWRSQNPEPQTELIYHNGFELLIAVILSAQATDISVNKITPRLFEEAPTAEKLAKLSIEEISEIIRSIGLYPTKAKNIKKCSQQLIENFGGQIPKKREQLESLAGVGRKTAGVVMNVLFQEKSIPVDTHVFRVSNRLGLVKSNNFLTVEKLLLKRVPGWALGKAHHWLILHGRYVCKARKPNCEACNIKNYCEYFAKNH